ncbi:hypothetical protein [Saccharopolyspora sp. NPDC002686]|uniref:COG4315 family predicted lipoprotein n=1 Tax=Saccharopolyspora sp. NPDC002686 TaxID=3154541 RepID=UPI00332A8CB2
MSRAIRHRTSALGSIGLVCGALALVAACVAPGQEPAGAGVGTPPPPSPAPPVTGGTISVQARQVPDLGAVLTGPDGRTVYLFDKDGKSEPTCREQCASDWPPLTTTDPPVAGAGVKPELLSTALRPDGKQQVVYNGHPLYYYVGDEIPGQTNGHGVFSDGGYWYALSPDGNQL